MTMPQIFADPDLFDAVIAERKQAPPAVTIPDSARTKRDLRTAKKAVWDARENILGVLHRPMHVVDICRMTGQLPETVAVSLMKLEAAGEIRRREEEMWERIPP